jgi:hypothetical protein
MSRNMKLIVFALALTLCTGSALAATAPPADTLKVDYFSNANTGDPDGTLRITNAGTSGGSLCAAIYVFDPMQELSECCSCLVSPNGLRTLSVDTDLTKNPLTGGTKLSTGSIRIVSTTESGGSCPLPYQGRVTPTAGVRSWTTHIQSASAITETASQDATLSAAELAQLERGCYAIALDGSGSGVCSCGTGD